MKVKYVTPILRSNIVSFLENGKLIFYGPLYSPDLSRRFRSKHGGETLCIDRNNLVLAPTPVRREKSECALQR
jgi:hypothetical protein